MGLSALPVGREHSHDPVRRPRPLGFVPVLAVDDDGAVGVDVARWAHAQPVGAVAAAAAVVLLAAVAKAVDLSARLTDWGHRWRRQRQKT